MKTVIYEGKKTTMHPYATLHPGKNKLDDGIANYLIRAGLVKSFVSKIHIKNDVKKTNYKKGGLNNGNI